MLSSTTTLVLLSLNALFSTGVLGDFSQIAIQNPTCDITGDPDVYGPGFRYGFYLKSSAYLIILAFKLDDEIRTILISSNIIAFAVYANTYMGAAERDFVIIE